MDVSNEVDKSSTQAEGNSILKDRLSSLPDEIIHRILSFLDARSAIQSSVLSKHWKDLWKSLPIIIFHDQTFDDPWYFEYFVDDFLFYRDSSSNVYMLKFECHHELENGYIVDSIIDYIVPKDIQVVSILAECVVQKLPQLFTSQTLTTLMLSNIKTETTTFGFVSLQRLYLDDCKFECDDYKVLDPFSGCPNLQCLFLHGCIYFGNFERFKIYAPQLKELSISSLRVDEQFDSNCVIELFTPKLHSLSYEDDQDLYDFSIEVNLPSIEKVDIDVGSLELSKELMETEASDLSLKLIKLFEAMGSAKFISLSSSIFQVLSMFPGLRDGRSTPFTRVHSFELIMDGSAPFPIPSNVMTYLFGGSPSFGR